MAPFSKNKIECRGIGQKNETMERFQMGPTYLSLVYKHRQYKVEGCWSYTERMILAVTGPFFSSWMPTLPTEFELLWRNANCSRHVLIFCNWNSKTLLEPWMATAMAVVNLFCHFLSLSSFCFSLLWILRSWLPYTKVCCVYLSSTSLMQR